MDKKVCNNKYTRCFQQTKTNNIRIIYTVSRIAFLLIKRKINLTVDMYGANFQETSQKRKTDLN